MVHAGEDSLDTFCLFTLILLLNALVLKISLYWTILFTNVSPLFTVKYLDS